MLRDAHRGKRAALMWDTGGMRLYVPAVLDELSADQPPVRPGYVAILEDGLRGDDIEEREDSAMNEAALASLELIRDRRDAEDEEDGDEVRACPDSPAFCVPARRVVIACEAEAEVSDEAGDLAAVHVAQARPQTYRWDDVVAFFIDDAEAAPLVERVTQALTEDDVTEALDALWDEPLLWFDASERTACAGGGIVSCGRTHV